MSRCPAYVLALLLGPLIACESATDGDDGGVGDAGVGGGAALGGRAESGGSSGLAGAGEGRGGAVAGHPAQSGGAGEGGSLSSAGAGAHDAASTSGGGVSVAGGSAGVASGGRAGSATFGGSAGHGGGGAAAAAGTSGAAGAGGEPSSACVNPLETVDVSRLLTSEVLEPYVVTGSTANQIRQSINQNRDMEYDAYTGWYVGWRFADCFGNGLSVTVDLTYSFPEWEPSASASPQLIASWETYMDALFCHEYGHAKHGLDCANEVFTALSAIDAGGNCAEQQSRAAAAFDAILEVCNQRDAQYDADTNHGGTMGARFPP